MDLLRIFQAAVLVGLGATVAACHSSRQQLESAKAEARTGDDSAESAYAQATDTRVVGKSLEVYIGEIFVTEQKALATKPPDADAPSF